MNIVQFALSRQVAGAADISAIKARARSAGVQDVRFGYNDRNAPSGHTRITCSVEMARFLVEELRVLAGAADQARKPDMIISCARGVAAATAAIAEDDDVSRNYLRDSTG